MVIREVPLSIVIAVRNAAEIVQCLEALCPQARSAGAEIIVADASDDGTDAIIKMRFPDVQLLHFFTPLNIPELRTKAIAVTYGRIIAVLDAFSIVSENWVSEVLRSHRERHHLVIGGAVELDDAASQDLVNWTEYINEYGMFMLPRKSGEVDILPGSNISYKREALFDRTGPKHRVFWKTFVNQELEAAGHKLWLDSSIVVRLRKAILFIEFFRTCYDHGCCFAGLRSQSFGIGRWIIYAVAFPLLPFIFLWRWGSKYWIKRCFRIKFVMTLPLQFLLFSSWSVGEFMGYLCGPGDSCNNLHY